jgi:hypothetical protein
LYPRAIEKVGPEKFQRNFARFLKKYGKDLNNEASNDAQHEAAHFVRTAAQRTAAELRRLLGQDDAGFAGAERPETAASKTAQINEWLNRNRAEHDAELPSYADMDAGTPPEDGECSDDSESGESENLGQSSLHTLEEVQAFMSSAQAYMKLRQDFRTWLKLDAAKTTDLGNEVKEKTEDADDLASSELEGKRC